MFENKVKVILSNHFIFQELIDQKKLVQLYGPELKQGSKDSPPTSVFNEMSEEGMLEVLFDDFFKALFVIYKYLYPFPVI